MPQSVQPCSTAAAALLFARLTCNCTLNLCASVCARTTCARACACQSELRGPVPSHHPERSCSVEGEDRMWSLAFFFLQAHRKITRFLPYLARTHRRTQSHTDRRCVPEECWRGLCEGFCCSAVCLSDKEGLPETHQWARVAKPPLARFHIPLQPVTQITCRPPPPPPPPLPVMMTHCLVAHREDTSTHRHAVVGIFKVVFAWTGQAAA